MSLHELSPAPGARSKSKKRLGQGIGSGTGKTAGKGNKGQKARSGGGVRPGFEGGQMPMMRRIPKKGFNNARFAKEFQIVNVESLASRFEAGETVGFSEMYAARLVQKDNIPVKVLASGEIDKALTVRAQAFSAQAKAKIEAAGGKAEVI
ncbi:50S ribosomal protein L15 [Aminivibrio sp.]|jgi:large subunit ribosomal protein L15|uniref:50S ribosomal protein L15 n=1 Tax=Aminivibrio sp. TaxID=1872489 RepID=UPI001A5B7242|nr:50S ribosomal protein L15 [Aminivibrio sp.]MBL3539496.1 50S ribosomal protein L15 [Aminivibrio sp.]MDK2959309.1 large subunit ribosomal protein [Synergistaceae bacterium]